MRIKDIRDALTIRLDQLNLPIYVENVAKMVKPCIYVNIVNVDKKFISNDRQKLKVSWDIIYLPKDTNESNNIEIYETLDDIDEVFDIIQYKYLKVKDRYIPINNSIQNEVNGKGHYMFDIDLYTNYGKVINYEMMEELIMEELEIN